MKKTVLFLLILVCSLNCFSQENYLGKTYDEIGTMVSRPTHNIYYGRKAIFENVDSVTMNIFIFNNYNVCYEYDKVFNNVPYDDVQGVLKNYTKSGDAWTDYNQGYAATIVQVSLTSYKVSYRKIY